MVIFENDVDQTLLIYYERRIIGIPIGSLALILTWLKVWKIIRYMKIAKTEHRIKLTKDPSALFAGVHLGKWRTRLMIFGCILTVILKLIALITMSDCLGKAVRRLPNSNMKVVDSVCVVLFSFIVVGAIACFVSVCHAGHRILLLLRRVPFPKRRYPLLIYDHAGDDKPALLL